MDRYLDSIKMKILAFQGKNNSEDYLEWKKMKFDFFIVTITLKDEKVKHVVIEFIDYAIIWWDQHVFRRRRKEERHIETWDEMKTIMRKGLFLVIIIGNYIKDCRVCLRILEVWRIPTRK